MTPNEMLETLDAMHITQRKLSEILGCNDTIVRRWTKGKARIPSVVTEWLAARMHVMAQTPPPKDWKKR